MNNMEDDLTNSPLDESSLENLRMENELLRLKLIAETGARSETMGEINPAIENEFLKNVLAFEQNYSNATSKTVYETLAKPIYKKANELNDYELAQAYKEVIDLLHQHHIEVDFGDDYPIRTKYIFITDELFAHEMDGFSMPGMTTHYIYEEFHPNHKLDIQNRTEKFMTHWFNQSFDEYSWELGEQFVLPNRTLMTKAEVLAQLKRIFEAYTAFTDTDYFIGDVKFDLQGDTGLGHAEGGVKYNAILESGEITYIAGPFKFYLSLEEGYWSIFHLVFPGFGYQ